MQIIWIIFLSKIVGCKRPFFVLLLALCVPLPFVLALCVHACAHTFSISYFALISNIPFFIYKIIKRMNKSNYMLAM